MNRHTSNSELIVVNNLKTWFPIKRGIFSRTVGYVKAVDGVSVVIRKGETLGLVGESGCGKTTLGRTILKLEKAHSGQVLFAGKDFFNLPRRETRLLRKKMQMIFQDPLSSLNPRMNIMDIVTEGRAEFRMLESSRRADAVKLINEVGLSEDVIFRYPHEFSGGQRQRISIARAIAVRPDFIVCDEAVSALDVSVQAQVVNLLIDLQETYQLSYLFISHDLSVVSHIADRIAVMYLGKIVEYGDKQDIIQNPLHPYTKALLASVPEPGVYKERKRLEGETPSPIAPPPGCRFHPRCPECMEICRTIEPGMTRRGTREVLCHLF